MKKTLVFLLLCCTFAALFAQEEEFEAGRGSRVAWARLKFRVTGYNPNGNVALGWFYHPTGDVRMVDWLRANTDINIKEEWNIVDVARLDQMCEFPMLFLSGKGSIDLNAKEKRNLREYILRGGFLFVDDCVALRQPKEDIFFTSVNNLVREILPEVELKKLPLSHPVFHCYYDIKRWTHMQGMDNGLWGAWYKGRLIMLTNSSDLHCAWTGFHFTQAQRKAAFQIAANIYVYVMAN